VEHLEISGLTFRFTTPTWSLTTPTWDFSTKPWGLRNETHPGCVRVWGSGQDIRIANCLFEHVFFPIRIRSLVAGTGPARLTGPSSREPSRWTSAAASSCRLIHGQC
jgi:hypothetical protein